MKSLIIPPLYMGLSLLFWGWHTEQWLFAIPMAIAYEIHWLINSRWHFSDVNIRRAASIATVSLIGIYAFIAVTGSWLNALGIFFQWLPITLYPIVLLQTYGDTEKINFRSLLIFAKFDARIAQKKRNFNVKIPYFIICILSASGKPDSNFIFYILLTIISVIPLWQLRSSRFNIALWLCTIVLAANLGFVGQIGLRQLHYYTEQQVISWLGKFYQGQADPFQQSTFLGQIGEIKQSNAIAFRVQTKNHHQNQSVPRLFREAAYNKYQGGLWIATDNAFTTIKSNNKQDLWQWHEPTQIYDSVTVIDQTIKGKAIAKLPPGSFRIEQLPAQTVEVNQYGVIRLESKQKSLHYGVDFNRDMNHESPPTSADLEIPKTESSILQEIIQNHHLQGENPSESLANLETFFLKDFKYSLKLTEPGDRPTPIASFLLDQKQGHCEYFATATTLLLREMGIPSRYVVGYVVQEYNPWQKQYLVRDRHAHAWTVAYLEGQWQTVDTTPANWADLENEQAQEFTILSDWLSWAWLQIKLIFSNIFKNILTPENIQRWWWIILPILLLRLWFGTSGTKEKINRIILPQHRFNTRQKNVQMSKFVAIELAFNQLGFERHSAQPLQQWLRELQKNEITVLMVIELEPILQWHYRDRFDPQGLSPEELIEFQRAIEQWLQRWHR